MTEVLDPLGNRTTTSYDLAGNLRSVKNAVNVTTSYAYDALYRPTRVIEDKSGSLERTTTMTYDAVGNLLTTVDPRGKTTSYSYDALNRQITRTNALGVTTTTSYNTLTRQVSETTDALGNTTTRTYDRLGQLESVSRPGGGTATYVYDAVGNRTVEINELGNRTTFVYDSLNRHAQTTDPLNGKTTFVYDANDNRTVVIDPLGNRTTSTYDAANRLAQETDPLNKSATFAYDAASRLASTTDRLGRRRDFAYDDADQRLTEKWYTSGNLLQTHTFTYDALRRMLSAADPDGTTTYTYDALNRRATVQDQWGLTLTYSYDASDNRTGVQDSKGGLATMSFDAGNRQTIAKFTGNSATVRFDYAWTVRDQVESISRYSDLAGSTKIGTTSFVYDTRMRVTNIHHRTGAGANLENTTYSYDTHDRVSTKVVDGTTTTYQYDATDQLTSDTANSYSYDGNGNRTMSGYTTGTGNRTTNDGVYTYTYDDAGNRTKRSKGASLETWTYGYDHWNKLIWVEKRATDGGTLQLRVDYKYDALGNRIERLVDSDGNGSTDETNRYGYDGEHVWAVLDGSNNLGSRRMFGVSVDSPVVRVDNAGTVVWYLTDYQNSVTGLVSASGATLGSITYDGFGRIVTDTTGANGDGFKYTGREWDATVQLQYNRARYYDPAIGKWISIDPLGFDAGDANLYRYVGNGAVNGVDPSGLYKPLIDPALGTGLTWLGNFVPFVPVINGGAAFVESWWTIGSQVFSGNISGAASTYGGYLLGLANFFGGNGPSSWAIGSVRPYLGPITTNGFEMGQTTGPFAASLLAVAGVSGSPRPAPAPRPVITYRPGLLGPGPAPPLPGVPQGTPPAPGPVIPAPPLPPQPPVPPPQPSTTSYFWWAKVFKGGTWK